MSNEALSRAIKEAGGPKALGDVIGISSQAISQWTECPPKRVLAVEAASGVPRHELRPDIFPTPSDADSAPRVVSGGQSINERAKPLRCLSTHGSAAFATEGQSR